MNLCGKRYSDQLWDDYVNEIAIEWNVINLKNLISKMALGVATYAIWRERNNISFSRSALSKEIILRRIH